MLRARIESHLQLLSFRAKQPNLSNPSLERIDYGALVSAWQPSKAADRNKVQNSVRVATKEAQQLWMFRTKLDPALRKHLDVLWSTHLRPVSPLPKAGLLHLSDHSFLLPTNHGTQQRIWRGKWQRRAGYDLKKADRHHQFRQENYSSRRQTDTCHHPAVGMWREALSGHQSNFVWSRNNLGIRLLLDCLAARLGKKSLRQSLSQEKIQNDLRPSPWKLHSTPIPERGWRRKDF